MIPSALILRFLPYLAAVGLMIGALMWHSSKVNSFGEAKFKGGEHATQEKWDKSTAEAVSAQLAANQDNQSRINNLEVERNENLNYIDKLDADNRALVKRLRLPKTACPSILPAVAATGGSQDTAAASGDIQSAISSGEEEALNDFDATYRSEAYRCDKLIEDVRPVLRWAEFLESK
ncbi:hypothetical protein UFOVP1155_36 [uncultured Caudovirales phage]|uniref:Uncharacterized protein n=1 Tax=uncultured Caudovirales phage TaxID=2100421 RepID=A0A6J5QSN0_9CAUD|nr:hypothetical protein UFOVP1155_36 [uncultured Caudovirales phage]